MTDLDREFNAMCGGIGFADDIKPEEIAFQTSCPGLNCDGIVSEKNAIAIVASPAKFRFLGARCTECDRTWTVDLTRSYRLTPDPDPLQDPQR